MRSSDILLAQTPGAPHVWPPGICELPGCSFVPVQIM